MDVFSQNEKLHVKKRLLVFIFKNPALPVPNNIVFGYSFGVSVNFRIQKTRMKLFIRVVPVQKRLSKTSNFCSVTCFTLTHSLRLCLVLQNYTIMI